MDDWWIQVVVLSVTYSRVWLSSFGARFVATSGENGVEK